MTPSRAPDVEKLVSSWLPSLPGVVAKLARGAKVAEVGCGFGASAVRMAQAFPTTAEPQKLSNSIQILLLLSALTLVPSMIRDCPGAMIAGISGVSSACATN